MAHIPVAGIVSIFAPGVTSLANLKNSIFLCESPRTQSRGNTGQRSDTVANGPLFDRRTVGENLSRLPQGPDGRPIAHARVALCTAAVASGWNGKAGDHPVPRRGRPGAESARPGSGSRAQPAAAGRLRGKIGRPIRRLVRCCSMAVPRGWRGRTGGKLSGRHRGVRPWRRALPSHGPRRSGSARSRWCAGSNPGRRHRRFRGNAPARRLRLRACRRGRHRRILEHRPSHPFDPARHPPRPSLARPRLRLPRLHPRPLPALPSPVGERGLVATGCDLLRLLFGEGDSSALQHLDDGACELLGESFLTLRTLFRRPPFIGTWGAKPRAIMPGCSRGGRSSL
jgi:hypothetical protein